MDQPDENRDRGPSALTVAGVGLGLLGATFGGIAGWFTLATAEPATTTVVATRTGNNAASTDGTTVGVGSGRAHTHTGGS